MVIRPDLFDPHTVHWHGFPQASAVFDGLPESSISINMFGTLNLGLSFTDEHEISTTTLWLRNTDDETAIRDFFNENRLAGDGLK